MATWIGALLLFFVWSSFHALHSTIPEANEPPELYTTECQDDLRATFVAAIREASESILLIIYSLNDSQIIKALREKAEAGVPVRVIHDASTYQGGFQRLGDQIERIEKVKTGLMHQKILVVDGKRVWIGSANMTRESLRLDENLVVGFWSPELGRALIQKLPQRDFMIGGQRVEFWSLPEDKEFALPRLLYLINQAQFSIQVAMFTWTHPELTEAIIRAHQRGVRVEIALDQGQAQGVSKKSLERLVQEGVPVRTNRGSELLHHKCALIDGKILINGSANWTRAAFSKNDDCFLIIHDLTEDQIRKLKKMWYVLHCITDKAERGFAKIAA